MNKRNILKASYIVGMVIAFPLAALIMQYLWNSFLVPAVDSINPIGYVQALGIFLLVKLLGTKSTIKKDENAK